MNRYLAISTDNHAGLPPAQYRDYLDPQYREKFDEALPIQIARTTEASKFMLVEEINEEWRRGHEKGLTGAWDFDERLKVLDGDCTAAEVIFPDGITEMNSPPFAAGIGLSPKGADAELQWAGARSHNRWLAEFCQMAPERCHGVAVVPATWDVKVAVDEVKWARKNGLGSIMVPVVWGDHDPYHHPKYDPLWAICQEYDMVVNFHAGAADSEQYFGRNWPPEPGTEPLVGGMGIYICEAVWVAARPLTFLIWGGVFERFPRLKVAVIEATATWVPSYLEHWDERYSDWQVCAKLGDYKGHLSMKPSDYFRRNVRLGSFLSRREIERRYEIGVECLTWASDYPHPEGLWPETVERTVEALNGIPEQEIAAVLGETAADFYGFDKEKLAPHVERIGFEKSMFQA